VTELIAHLLGDYVLQSDWMALEKTGASLPAAAHAATYAVCFLPLTRDPVRLAVIGGTHFVIDRWRLARYVVWAKNQAVPTRLRYPWSEGRATGYHQDRPSWMAVWLMIAADNTLHLLVNRLVLAAGDA
jgi:Protein of unknown function (DUF3307)